MDNPKLQAMNMYIQALGSTPSRTSMQRIGSCRDLSIPLSQSVRTCRSHWRVAVLCVQFVLLVSCLQTISILLALFRLQYSACFWCMHSATLSPWQAFRCVLEITEFSCPSLCETQHLSSLAAQGFKSAVHDEDIQASYK